MSKPFTESDFSAQILEDRTWRIQEISDLKSAIRRGDTNLKKVLLRALVTICYAHWEGYIKFSARKYMEHVALRKFQFLELNRQFLRNYFLPRLASLSASKTSIAQRCELLDQILTSEGAHFRRANEDLINTKSNLNFEVFIDICLVCGVPTEHFAKKSTFIDIVLLKRRNSIAHGEETFVAVGDVDDVVNQTIDLMRTFGDSLENFVVLKTYRAS